MVCPAALAVLRTLVELVVTLLLSQDKLRIVGSCSCQGHRFERQAGFGLLVAEVRHRLAELVLTGRAAPSDRAE